MKGLFFKQRNKYIFLLFIIIIVSILNSFLIFNIEANIKYLNYFKSLNYDYSVNIENEKQDCYFDCKYRFSVNYNENGSFSNYITSNSFMLCDIEYQGQGYYKKENIIEGEYKILAHNEVSITKNIKNKFNLSINDSIFSKINDVVYEFKIANILKNTYDFSFPESGEYQKYIFMGYNEYNNDEKSYLSFIKIKNEDIADKNAKNTCIVSNIIKKTTNEITLQIGAITISCLILVAVYFILVKKDKYNFKLLFNNGYRKNYLYRLNIYQSLVMFLCSSFILGLMSFIQKINFLVILIECGIIFLLILLINTFKIFKEVR